MNKMTLSPGFQKFAAKTTKGKFDEVRKAESRASGCPLPIGTTGVATIDSIIGKETKAAEGKPSKPILMIKLNVETPDEHQGVSLSGPGLMFTIGAGPNSTEEESWQRMLDSLELMGLPRDLRTNYEDFQECIDWFTKAEPRRVTFTVEKDNWSGNASGKTVRAVAYHDESAVESADSVPTDNSPVNPDAKYVLFLNKKHEILKEENGILTLKSPSGRERTVPADSPDIDRID